MKGELSENELRYKAEAYCSSMESFGICRMRDTLTRSVFARLLFVINIALTNGAE